MAAGILVSLEEYLAHTYQPDMDYDDGTLIERNVGQEKHSRAQALITAYTFNHEEEWGIRVFPRSGFEWRNAGIASRTYAPRSQARPEKR